MVSLKLSVQYVVATRQGLNNKWWFLDFVNFHLIFGLIRFSLEILSLVASSYSSCNLKEEASHQKWSSWARIPEERQDSITTLYQVNTCHKAKAMLSHLSTLHINTSTPPRETQVSNKSLAWKNRHGTALSATSSMKLNVTESANVSSPLSSQDFQLSHATENSCRKARQHLTQDSWTQISVGERWMKATLPSAIHVSLSRTLTVFSNQPADTACLIPHCSRVAAGDRVSACSG